MCDGGHFAAFLPSIMYLRVWSAGDPRGVDMARALRITKTRFARWISTFRERRYYDTIE